MTLLIIKQKIIFNKHVIIIWNNFYIECVAIQNFINEITNKIPETNLLNIVCVI